MLSDGDPLAWVLTTKSRWTAWPAWPSPNSR